MRSVVLFLALAVFAAPAAFADHHGSDHDLGKRLAELEKKVYHLYKMVERDGPVGPLLLDDEKREQIFHDLGRYMVDHAEELGKSKAFLDSPIEMEDLEA